MLRIIIIRWLYAWFGLLGFNITQLGDVLWRDCRYFGQVWLWSWYPCLLYIYTHTLRVMPIHFGRETVPSAWRLITMIAYTSTTPAGYTSLQPDWISIYLIIFYTRTIVLWSQNILIIQFHYWTLMVSIINDVTLWSVYYYVVWQHLSWPISPRN